MGLLNYHSFEGTGPLCAACGHYMNMDCHAYQGDELQALRSKAYEGLKKPTNPKDSIGSTKPPTSTLPARVIALLGVAMLEGSCKYGRHNYRDAGVRASVYYDAAHRHMEKWYEGQDIDPDSGLPHIIKAMASLLVLQDGILHKNYNDDRPPKIDPAFWHELEEQTTWILAQFPRPAAPFTEKK